MIEKRLFAGHIVRQARQQLGLTQRALAQKLSMSAAYLNQIERDVRPISNRVRAGLHSSIGLELDDLAQPDQAKALSIEARLFERGLDGQSRARLQRALGIFPELSQALLSATAPQDSTPLDPYAEIGDWFYLQDNHIAGLDQAAEDLFNQADLRYAEMDRDLVVYLRRFGIQVEWVDDPQIARSFQPEDKRVRLGRWLSASQRAFQLAQLLMWQTQSERVEDIVRSARLESPGADDVLRIGLANYFAGALVMPYTEFLKTAQRERYDLERLQRQFNVSFESASHRLSTLQRPGQQGVPFYFVRVDAAGQIMKRQSPAGFHFARQGGACPLWNVHEALTRPDQILVQRVVTPDEREWLCLAQAVIKPGPRYGDPARRFSVGIGCEAKYASSIVYADGLNMRGPQGRVEIGPGCRHCLRPSCPQRAFAPVGRTPQADIHQRSRIPLRWD
ncbi:MAG: helix-turn-helix domain-containing protein [Litorivicinus sp.]